MVDPMITRSMKKSTDEDKLGAEKEPVLAELFPAKKALFNRRKQIKGSNGNKGDSCRGYVLPFEIIIEILSWLSVKKLLQCKSVCKQWNHLIQERYFIEKHMKRAKLHKEFIDKTEEDQPPFRWLTSMDGLLLERNNVSGNLRVRNPAMRRSIDLPGTNNSSIHATICYAKSSGYYKIASLNNLNEAQILTLGENQHPSWRSLDTPIFGSSSGRSTSTAFHGVVHYFSTIKDSIKIYVIKSLDIDTEIIMTSVLPGNAFSHDANVFLMRMGKEDIMALGEIVNDELHFLELMDYKKSKWAEKKTVIPLKFVKKDPEKWKFLEPCGFSRGFGFVLLRQRSDIIHTNYLYDTKTEKITVIALPEGKDFSFNGPQTLVSFKGMIPDTSHVTGR